jgi:chemotaxis response regulator CheB
MALTRTNVVQELLELVAALDRRVPQVQRTAEASIARDAGALRARALKRIEELEREPSQSTVAVLASTGGHSAVTIPSDSGFNPRWAAWPTRSVAHQRPALLYP